MLQEFIKNNEDRDLNATINILAKGINKTEARDLPCVKMPEKNSLLNSWIRELCENKESTRDLENIILT